MRNNFLKFFLILAALLVLTHCEEEKPDMVVVLSRHGAREPLGNRFDPSWQNPTFLMDIGVQQHYALGAILAKKYAHLVDDLNPNEIFLQSTEYHRTQMSVSAELLGLFHDQTHAHNEKQAKNDFKIPFEDGELLDEISTKLTNTAELIPNRLQLLTQKVLPDAKEDLLQIDPVNCLAVRKGQQKRFTDNVNRKMTTDLIGSINQLRRLRYKVYQVYDLKEVGDIVMNRHIAGKSDLEGIPYGGSVYNDSVFAFKWWNMYNLVGTELERSLRVYPIYSRLIEWFSDKAKGESKLKMALLGGHESTMFPFLSLFNISDHNCFYENYKAEKNGQALPFPECIFPEYSSQLIFEFYNKTGSPYIKMLYNGKQRKLCRNGESLDCNLTQFIEELPVALNNMTKELHKQECAVQNIASTAPETSTPTTTTVKQAPPKTNTTTSYAQNVEDKTNQPETVESQDPDLDDYKKKVEEQMKQFKKEQQEKKYTSEALKSVAKDSLIVWLIVAVAVLGTIFTFIVFLIISGRLVLAESGEKSFEAKVLNGSSMMSNSYDLPRDVQRNIPVQGGDDEDEE